MNRPEVNPSKTGQCPQCGARLPAGVLAGLCPACLLKEGAAVDTGTQPGMPPFEPPPVAELARLFPQLEILALLGKGGMGAVYKARQPALDRFVALKILPARGGADSGFAERFTREARALARLSHPNIVGVHEFGQVDGLHYFLMEYVDGVNLRQLQKSSRLSPREALQIVPQICDALQYAHDEGVVHRDIKPENVLVDRRGRVKIADFGLAKILGVETPDLRLTGEGQVMGTPHYMAPEQVEHPLEVDHRADIFSLGVVFYELLTGELPLGKFAPPSRKVQVDVRLDEVVLHALEKEPQRRYQQANEVKTAVQQIASGAPAAPGGGSPVHVTVSVPGWAMGVDYRSKATLWGLPWVHVATGLDPQTGKRRIATGIIAIGNVARGVVAIGGLAMGGIACGGLALGGVAFGGLGLGLIALGGLVLALGVALGGGAVAPIAIGGGALGYWAYGGGAWGAHTLSGLGIDPWAWDFFEPRVEPLMRWFFVGILGLSAAIILLATLLPAWLQRREQKAVRSPGFWGQVVIALLCAGFCLVPLLFAKALPDMPRRYLVTGRVTDARTGNQLDGVTLTAVAGRNAQKVLGRAQSQADGRFSLVMQKGGNQVAAYLDGYHPEVVTLNTNAFDARRHAQVDVKLYPVPAASAETWSPPVGEGKSDLNKVLDEGRELMKRGAYEEALQRLIWYHNHLREFSANSPGAGLVYVVSEWVELGRRYPKAQQALLEIRDQKAQEFLQGKGYFELFQELATINQYLQDDQATLAVFEHIQQQDPALARQCYLVVRPLWMKNRQYQACLKYLGDPQAAFDRARQSWESQKQFEQRLEETYQRLAKDRPAFRRPKSPISSDDHFVGDVRQLVEILVGVGRKAEAENIRDQALALLNDPQLKSAVTDAEQRAQQQ